MIKECSGGYMLFTHKCYYCPYTVDKYDCYLFQNPAKFNGHSQLSFSTVFYQKTLTASSDVLCIMINSRDTGPCRPYNGKM